MVFISYRYETPLGQGFSLLEFDVTMHQQRKTDTICALDDACKHTMLVSPKDAIPHVLAARIQLGSVKKWYLFLTVAEPL